MLIETGGAGIAANQCQISDPYQFTIVGVFHHNAKHVINVGKRYPDIKFPEAVIMINPTIINSSEEMMPFRHGCLSVPGPLRGWILTPKEITVEYKTFDEEDNLIIERRTVKDIDAVVLMHELNQSHEFPEIQVEKIHTARLFLLAN